MLFLFLTACSVNDDFRIKRNFSSDVYISTEDINISGSVKFKNNELTLKIKSPENLNGYTYSIKNDTVTMTYMNLQTTIDINKLPQNAPAVIIYNTLCELPQSPEEIHLTDNRYTAECGNSTVTFNKNGCPDTITHNSTHITFIRK